MATSGTTSWTLQKDAAINAALRKIGVVSGGASPQTYEITNATETLNGMIKSWHADGMPVWAINDYSFATVAGTSTYTIGTGQTLNTPAPLKITQAYRNQGTTSANVPMNIYTEYNFKLLPTTASSSTPVNLWYQPLGATGVISLWPAPVDTSYTIHIVYQRPFEDMTASTDNFDFPSYWMEAVVYGLAARMAPEYGIPLQDRQQLMKEADIFHQEALLFGSEEGSIYMMPDWAGKK
jgi:hypothetical protein